MRIFASYIGDRWGIPFEVADAICGHYEQNDSLFFITDYVPRIVTRVDFDTVAEICRFLDLQKELKPVRERVRNVLKKADRYNDEAEANIDLSISAVELDDLAIAFRANVRTRGQVALSRGLGELADLLLGDFRGSVEEAAQKYCNDQEELKTVEEVLAGVADILSERFGYDEHARIVSREFAEDEGHVEVSVKKKNKKYDSLKDRPIPYNELSDAEILFLRDAEEKKDIKIKISVPLFHVMELLRQDFLKHPDSHSADIVLNSLAEAWSRLLQPMVEDAVKDQLFRTAQDRLIREISPELRSQIKERVAMGKQTVLVVAGYSEESIELVAVDNEGQLLRATTEQLRAFGKAFSSAKIKQLVDLYRPTKIVVLKNEFGENALAIVNATIAHMPVSPAVIDVPASKKTTSVLRSTFLKSQSKGLSETILKTYALGVVTIGPLAIVRELGGIGLTLKDDKQDVIPEEILSLLVDCYYTGAMLAGGVEIGRKGDDILLKVGISQEILETLRSERKAGHLFCKSDLASLPCINECLYNNLAGYVVFSDAQSILDKSTVHPEEFDVVFSICEELDMTPDELVKNSARLETYTCEDSEMESFVRERLFCQLRTAQRYQSLSTRGSRRMGWNEIRSNTIVEGKVTNIADFGVFVDINAISDGLVHISELAGEYVESADQVVHVGERVRVKILEVDRKKKRISLSMRQADNGGRRVRASQNQIADLANYFSNI